MRAPFEVSKVTSSTSRFSTCSTSHTPSAHGHQATHAARRTLVRRIARRTRQTFAFASSGRGNVTHLDCWRCIFCMLNQKKVLARHVLSTWSLSEAQSTRRTRKPVFADSSSSRSHSSANSVLSATVCVSLSLCMPFPLVLSLPPSLHTRIQHEQTFGGVAPAARCIGRGGWAAAQTVFCPFSVSFFQNSLVSCTTASVYSRFMAFSSMPKAF